MAKVGDMSSARARFAAEHLEAFAAYGVNVARTEEVGDAELWRLTARSVAHAHGRYVVTGHYGPSDELVWAKLYDHPVTAAERTQAHEAVAEAVVIAGGQMLSGSLPDPAAARSEPPRRPRPSPAGRGRKSPGIVGEEWPRTSDTTFTGTPSASMSVAAVWRVSWSRMRRRPLALPASSNHPERVSGWWGRPSSSATT